MAGLHDARISFASLDADVITRSANAILQSADLTVSVNERGVVTAAHLAADDSVQISPDRLVGRSASTLFKQGDGDALAELLDKARRGLPSGPLFLEHSADFAPGTCARYTAKPARNSGIVLLVGRQILPASGITFARAVETSDNEQVKQRRRDSEARYHLIFGTAVDGILFLDPSSGRIEEANPTIEALVGRKADVMEGLSLATLFDDGDRAPIDTMLSRVIADPGPQTVQATLLDHPMRVSMRAQLVRSFERQLVMIRVRPVGGAGPGPVDDERTLAVDLMRRSGTPIALASSAGTVIWCNAAFEDFVGSNGLGPIDKRPIDEILGLSAHALSIAMDDAQRRGSLSISANSLHDGTSALGDADISVVATDGPEGPAIGIVIHDDAPNGAQAMPAELAGSAGDRSDIAELVGQAPLKLLVRETTDVLERAFIESALKMTGNNRAAAAAVLGMSRQSLYAKLHHHRML